LKVTFTEGEIPDGDASSEVERWLEQIASAIEKETGCRIAAISCKPCQACQ
jgi:hypothetical protein